MCPQDVVLHCWAYNFAKLLLDWLTMFPECHLYLQNHLADTDAHCIAGSLHQQDQDGLRALAGEMAANQKEQQDMRTEEHAAAASTSQVAGGLDSEAAQAVTEANCNSLEPDESNNLICRLCLTCDPGGSTLAEDNKLCVLIPFVLACLGRYMGQLAFCVATLQQTGTHGCCW